MSIPFSAGVPPGAAELAMESITDRVAILPVVFPAFAPHVSALKGFRHNLVPLHLFGSGIWVQCDRRLGLFHGQFYFF